MRDVFSAASFLVCAPLEAFSCSAGVVLPCPPRRLLMDGEGKGGGGGAADPRLFPARVPAAAESSPAVDVSIAGPGVRKPRTCCEKVVKYASRLFCTGFWTPFNLLPSRVVISPGNGDGDVVLLYGFRTFSR